MKKIWKMERYRDASIQKKLTLSTWVVAIIPIMIIFAIVFFVFINVSVENSKRQSQMLLDKTVEELDSYFAQAQEGMNLMVTDINVQNTIDDYVMGTYKERLDLRDFIRNRLTNMSTVGRRTGAISIYIKEADKTFSRDFSDKDLSAACAGAPWFEALLAGDTAFVREDGDSLQDGRPVWILASNIVSVKNGEVQGLVYVELDKQKMIQPFYDLVEGSGDEIICSGNEIISDAYREGGHFVPVYSYSSALGQDVEFRLQLKELQRGYGAALSYFLIGMVVLIILIYLIDKLLADWFSRRIITLRDATREIATGNLDVVVCDDHTDEIGELVQSLNTMVKDMKRLIESEYMVKIESQQATLTALQSQINPHFIYNTLESISMLALIRDNYEIVDMAQAFSMMMRYSMEPSTLVAVREEVENVRNFVTIQKIRFPDRFLVEYAIDEECMAEKIPRLTMQPLVENAFKHGFEDTPEHKRLLVSVLKRRGFLVIRIFNDGMAVPAERIARIRELLMPDNQEETLDCFALRNLSRRLKLLFGGKSRVTLRSGNGIGTIVSLRIPLRKEGEEDDDKDFDL
ncbi:sensor histidine kinase [Hungatella effluvii]|uniref:sensor histidine kinase n=1 Tax=Hungatella effluvii TaxID=1096246 RepID=UPI0022DEF344|nr:sensor histidine kinase [Hungatella effluvii]